MHWQAEQNAANHAHPIQEGLYAKDNALHAPDHEKDNVDVGNDPNDGCSDTSNIEDGPGPVHNLLDLL